MRCGVAGYARMLLVGVTVLLHVVASSLTQLLLSSETGGSLFASLSKKLPIKIVFYH